MKRTAIVMMVSAVLLTAGAMALAVTPLPTTRADFELPGTQPLTITDPIATPDQCVGCHSNYGQPAVEPFQNWKGSMMAQAGRDPLMWAGLAVANQDAPHSGETCLRCHLHKGWLEGRSVPEDGSSMTAADRQGVQCGVCHRMVDPVTAPENPAVDGPILAGLGAPVPAFGGAMIVTDPLDRLRGPFDIITDLGSDPHAPTRSTLISPFHESAELCGSCHNLRNPAFTKNGLSGEWEPNPFATVSADPTEGFPEQSTFDEWQASTYATTGVIAPQFGVNQAVVSNCQTCHMPDVTGKDANLGLTRDDVPRHSFAGANTFIPSVLPFHPAFGAEVDPLALNEGIAKSTDMLHKAATVSALIAGGNLTVRVTNESGHKLPTGYPEGRRMWLHVRALDAGRHVVFESGRYVFSTATLSGYDAQLSDPDYDPYLHVWETRMGISPDVAALTGLPAGETFHLVLNNVRLKDNRIPPRGFSNAAFEAFDGEPVGATYADGQYWDEVVYPVGGAATQAEVRLYYQTSSREYVEFLRDENVTTSAGSILFDLWDDHNRSEPVTMANVFVETDAGVVNRCRRQVSKLQTKYRKRYMKEWGRCFKRKANGSTCDAPARDARIAAEASRLRSRLGGSQDRACAGGASLTPGSLGHGPVCASPCAQVTLVDMSSLADCAICLSEAADSAALQSAYGATPPTEPATAPPAARSCLAQLDSAAAGLVGGWIDGLSRCERDNATGANAPPLVCASDPQGDIADAVARSGSRVARCGSFSGLNGCATAGTATDVATCIENAVGAVVAPFVEVAYP
jgi:hypothetical protein